MRGAFLLLALIPLACVDYPPAAEPNEIVFGIHQRTDEATGKTEVSAGYEYLSLAKKGGWVNYVFRDGDGEGTCYFERFDQRLGHPRVEGGTATWQGGQLPVPGLTVHANQPEPSKHEGVGWGENDVLSFQVDGFAMPRIHRLTMNAPGAELPGTVVAPPSSEIKSSDDVGVTWTPVPSDDGSRVMVTIETEEDDNPGGGVRCFASSKSGSIVVPSKWVSRLFESVEPAKPIKGHIEIASHRQITYVTHGDWIVYVIATALHKQVPFTGLR